MSGFFDSWKYKFGLGSSTGLTKRNLSDRNEAYTFFGGSSSVYGVSTWLDKIGTPPDGVITSSNFSSSYNSSFVDPWKRDAFGGK